MKYSKEIYSDINLVAFQQQKLNGLLSESVLNNADLHSILATEFTTVQSEIHKLSLPTPSSVDWEKIEGDCFNILEQGCEDLNIANYLVIALVAHYGAAMMVVGVVFLEQYVLMKWRVMRPSITNSRVRIRSIDWFFERLFEFISHDIEKYDRETVLALNTAIYNYTTSLSTLLLNQYVLPEKIRQLLKSQLKKETAQEKPISTVRKIIDRDTTTQQKLVSSITESALVSNTVTDQEQNINDQNGKSNSLHQCQSILRQLVLLESDKNINGSNVFYYRRVSAWLNIHNAPSHNNLFISQLKGPSVTDKKNIVMRQKDRNPEKTLLEAEKMLERFPLWLDANFITIEALQSINDDTTNSENTILLSLNTLLSRIPKLKDIKFSDGGAMFGKKCRAYFGEINTFESNLLHTKPVQILHAESSSHMPITKSDQEEKSLEAVTKQRQINSSNCLYTECKSHLDQIRYCMNEKKYDLAIAKITYLWKQVSKMSFLTWEVDMALSLSVFHIDAILNVSGKKFVLSEENKKLCWNKYQYISGLDTRLALEIDTSRFLNRKP